MRLICLSALIVDFTYLYTQTKIGFGGMGRIFVNEDFCSKKVLLCIHSDFDSPPCMSPLEGISMLSSSNDT